MSSSVEASVLMRRIAEPAPAGAHVEMLIRRVARQVGITFSRAKSIWYREARVIRAEEMDAIRAAAAAKQDGADSELARKYREIAERVARIESQLAARREDVDG